MPGTVTTRTGPNDPTHNDQKMAGFSIDAHRRYRKGWEKNRGAADMMPISISSADHGFRSTITHSIDHMQ